MILGVWGEFIYHTSQQVSQELFTLSIFLCPFINGVSLLIGTKASCKGAHGKSYSETIYMLCHLTKICCQDIKQRNLISSEPNSRDEMKALDPRQQVFKFCRDDIFFDVRVAIK